MYLLFLTAFTSAVERQRGLGRRLAHRGGQVEAEELRHVLHLREVRQVVQAEAGEELARRAVEKRAADDVLAADDLDEFPFDQRADDAGGLHAADFRDLG